MSGQKPLKPDQIRAATLLGQGRTQEEVAKEAGTSTTSIRRWLERDDFKALVKQAREAVLDENPTAQSTLESALNATNKNGVPIWPIRVKAAQLLMLGAGSVDPNGDDSTDSRERIYIGPED